MADSVPLPAADEAPRCSAYAREHGVDPGGSAIRADRIIAAEVPLPWPKPVFDHELLRAVPAAVEAVATPVRVLAAVPRRPDGELEVVAFDRLSGGGASRRLWACSPDELEETVVAAISTDPPTDAAGTRATAEAAGHDRGDVPSAEVWVCTQGSHDVCCGSEGTRLAEQLDARWIDVVIRRVSHTGGHRFAPTALTLPDGRMWGFADVDLIDDVLRRSADTTVLAPRCRGWWGADTGAAQVAERAVFASEGWTWESAPRSARIVSQQADCSLVRVTAGERPVASWLVTVGVAREVPTIACRAPGGLPAKPGLEYQVHALERES